MTRFNFLVIGIPLLFSVSVLGSEPNRDVPEGRPVATIDLMKEDGLRQVSGHWRTSDVALIPSDFDGTTKGVYDYSPHAGAVNYDDSNWPVTSKDSLEGGDGEKGHEGRLSFEWYRLTVTIPERIGEVATTGTTVVFETTIDDYSEIWVNGELLRWIGQTGQGVISGFNVPNRIVIGRNVTPGQKIQIAVFGINGPISAAPANTVFMRKGTRLDFYCCLAGPVAFDPVADVNAGLDDPNHTGLEPIIINRDPHLRKLAEGFRFNGALAWSEKGYLLINDIEAGAIYKYDPVSAQLSLLKLTLESSPAGRGHADVPKPNGLTLDPQGALVVAQNGNRNIVRIGEDGSSTVLADTYEGKPLNGPHDLMYRSDGVLYFSDPRASLPERINISKSSRPSSGVYSLYKGRLQLLTKDLAMPLGLALSRTGKYLFVIDGEANTVMRFDANADGSVSNTKLFFNLADLPWKQPSRGIAVDEQGNVYVAGPGGISIISPEGKRLGTILLQNQPRELAWGDLNGKALYLTTSDAVYQLRIGIPGVRSAGSKP